MPAYAKDGKIVFQSAQRFKTRYATLGFMHGASLDEGAMWPAAFAEGVDCRRRGEDRRAREESGELRTEVQAPILSFGEMAFPRFYAALYVQSDS